MAKNKFILIDGNAILHRAFHANPRFEIDGKLVNAIYGFISTVFSTISKFNPDYLAIAFDVRGPTFRDEIFDEYKAKRIKPPQEFYDQIEDVWDFVKTMEIPLLSKAGFEADDVIGTIAKRINGDLKDGEVIIVTGDQDTLQLVDQRTKVAMPAMGKIKETIYDEAAVVGKIGINPNQIIDYKALSGDSSDNIPGVRGIGEKTTVSLLKEFKSIKNVYNEIDKKGDLQGFKPRITNLLREGRDFAFMSQKLATIKRDVELEFKLPDAKTHDFDETKVIDFLNKYRFKSLIKRLPQSQRKAGQQEKLF